MFSFFPFALPRMNRCFSTLSLSLLKHSYIRNRLDKSTTIWIYSWGIICRWAFDNVSLIIYIYFSTFPSNQKYLLFMSYQQDYHRCTENTHPTIHVICFLRQYEKMNQNHHIGDRTKHDNLNKFVCPVQLFRWKIISTRKSARGRARDEPPARISPNTSWDM